MRLALGVAYDGVSFCGWQSQPNACGVQDALEKALSQIAASPIAVVCAGRTDTGVHAIEQVVHFDTAANRPMQAWVRGVNALLPAAVAVQWAQQVPDDFHARFLAQRRCYRYILFNHPVRPALWAGKVGWFHQPLDVAAMRQAAALLLGEHDFSAFRAAECQAKSPIKQMYEARVEQQGEFIVFHFCANAFLHHMVRNLVGSLVYIGKGSHPPGWMGELLRQRDRSKAAPTFAPDGLYLERVAYPAGIALPQLGDGSMSAPLPFAGA